MIGGSVKKAQRSLCLTDKSIFVIQVASFVFLLQQNTVEFTTEIAKIAGWGPSGEELLGKGQGWWQQPSLLAVLFNILSPHGSRTLQSRASRGRLNGRPQRQHYTRLRGAAQESSS